MRRSVIFSRPVAAALVLLAALGLLLLTSPAYAAGEDVITNLDVAYEVRADGTVGVTHRLDYRFGETGRRGILFSIIHKEPYGDGIHDARYDISRIAVDSPSGAPDTFEQTADTRDGTEQTTLRIGDADQPLTTREASYLISYELAGALETHDGYAELYRDVTTDYPQVERYSVSVTAPGGVSDTECAAGPSVCTEAVDQGTARYTGTNLAQNQSLTVAAKLDSTRISNATPRLELQPITAPRTLTVDATTTLRPDAVVTVTQVTTYRFPANGGEVIYAIPVRRPFSDTEDQLFHVADPVVTDATGARLSTQQRIRNYGSDQTLLVTVEPNPATLSPEGIGTITLSYEVTGAVHGDRHQARFGWPLVTEAIAPFTQVTAAYRVPGTLSAVMCERASGSAGSDCGLPPPVREDQAATFFLPREQRATPAPDQERVVVTVPAESVGNPAPMLAESIDRREIGRMGMSFLATIGIFAALITGAVVTTRRPAFPNLRYAGVPPGVLNAGGPVVDDDRVHPPVRFEPPDTDLATAGRLLDGRYLDRHTTAEIVAAAVRGRIRIQMQPFTLWQGPGPSQPATRPAWFDAPLLSNARPPGDPRPTSPMELTSLVAAVKSYQPSSQRGSTVFRSPEDVKRLKKARRGKAFALFAGVVIVLSGLRFALVPVLGGWVNGMLFFGIVAALIACLIWMKRVGSAPLSAQGTALIDQIVGFRTYLATTEAHQLRFEAGQDIYSRYLPWAVLFDLTDKWTATCQQLVAQGAIRPLRTGWIDQPPARLGVMTTNIGYELSRSVAATRAAAAAASSGSSGGFSSGSGGASAFSGGGISSGGGGGGTSTSSW